MKAIYIGVMSSQRNEGLDWAFNKRCTDYLTVNPGDPDLVGNLTNVSFSPDIVFIQVQGDQIQGRSTVEVLGPFCERWREQGAFVINWTGDIRYGIPPWMVQFASWVDLTAFSNMRDVKNFKGPAEYLQIGIDPVNYNVLSEVVTSKYEVVFFANHYENHFPLSGFRKHCAEGARALLGERFGLFGTGWPDYLKPNGNLNVKNDQVAHYQQLEASYYRGCKIALSISHYKEERYTSDRLLRALACGAFTITQDYPGIEKEFIPGQHLVTFEHAHELPDLISYWLAPEKDHERKLIGAAAAELVGRYHTYTAMVDNIINLRG